MHADVTSVVCTKNRYDVLSQTLLSIALQSVKPKSILIFDDSDDPKDIREFPAYQSVLHLFNHYGIEWQVVFGRKLGQHHLHQWSQELATTDLIWRIDDDEIAEPDVLEKLIGCIKEDVGAVAGLVLPPAPSPVPPDAANIISDLNRPNVQWFKQAPQLLEVEHLHSTFLYRRGIADYELSLSPAAHREETIFTYSIKRHGFKLIVNTEAITWHFPAGQGGIRAHNQHPEYWENDEKIFNTKLQEWGVNCEPTKYIVLDCGRGDHVIVKSLIPRLKEKYGKLIVATCYTDIFNGEVEQISIAEAQRRLGPLDRFSIYRWCIDHNWTGNLVTAHEKLYGLE